MPKTLRTDWDAIVALVPERAGVLDLGCGDGELLARLVSEKRVSARGVEINEDNVRACIARGLSVRHGNIEDGLADYSDHAFDVVILSQTLAFLNQPGPVVREMLRVGREAVVSFDNAGYWRTRAHALLGDGFGPELDSGQPRARAVTLPQFRRFAASLGAHVERAVLLSGSRRIARCPSWRAATAVFVLSRRRTKGG